MLGFSTILSTRVILGLFVFPEGCGNSTIFSHLKYKGNTSPSWPEFISFCPTLSSIPLVSKMVSITNIAVCFFLIWVTYIGFNFILHLFTRISYFMF